MTVLGLAFQRCYCWWLPADPGPPIGNATASPPSRSGGERRRHAGRKLHVQLAGTGAVGVARPMAASLVELGSLPSATPDRVLAPATTFNGRWRCQKVTLFGMLRMISSSPLRVTHDAGALQLLAQLGFLRPCSSRVPPPSAAPAAQRQSDALLAVTLLERGPSGASRGFSGQCAQAPRKSEVHRYRDWWCSQSWRRSQGKITVGMKNL